MTTIRLRTILNSIAIPGKTVLDYEMKIQLLKEKDRVFFWEGTRSNYSIAGFEMQFYRHKMTYIIQYYITSGLIVIVSWVRICLNYLNTVSY